MLHILLLLLSLSSNSLGEDSITLSSENEFTDFVNSVNSKNDYSGTTVYLGTDITLTGNIDPIGKDYYQFCGIFDGQGHVISSLTINSSSLKYTGLFGFSRGLTIKNVVLDDSCSITSTFIGNANVRVGGIIGECWAINDECNIENSVNMASVTFNGNTTGYYGVLLIGGIVGWLYSTSYNAYVKNCVNYGSVTHSGTVSSWAELSGIVGEGFSQNSRLYNCYIQNCLNYGTITHNGTSGSLSIGGAVGSSNYTYIENCVSAGKVVTQTKASGENNCIGSFVGDIDSSNTFINYCYYTNDVNVSSLYGAGSPSTTGTPTSSTSVDSDLVSKLNSNTTSCKWLLNTNKTTVTFKMSDEKELSFSSQIILIPNPVKEGNSFLFWCKDPECTEVFDPETESVSGNTELYAAWVNNTVTFDFDNGTTVNVTFAYNTEIVYPDMKKEGYTLSWNNYHELMPAKNITVTAQWTPNNYTVTFDFNNGTIVNVTFSYNSEITYPDVKKEGYTFSQWSNYREFMPARDITVTAQWTPNNYTVTFDANGGNVSETSKIVTFNEKYGDLPTPPKKEGYMFLGWFTSETNGTEVTNETIVTIPHNHTLYAHWEEVTNQVEIVFSTKDLTQEEVKNIIEQYTNADFEITQFENESGEIRIIIGFTDKEEAEEFVRNVKESSNAMNVVKRIDFDQGIYGSFSTTTYPLTFFSVLFL